MTLSETLFEVTGRGFRLSLASTGEVEVSGPADQMSLELRDALVEHKPAIASLLSKHSARVERVKRDEKPQLCLQAGWVICDDDHGCVIFRPDEEYREHRASSDDWWSRLSDEDYLLLTSPPQRPPKCVWCSGIYRHSQMCRELHNSWAVTMPFGKHKGKKLTEVPPKYLRWAYRKSRHSNSDLLREIERVLDSTGFRINARNAE